MINDWIRQKYGIGPTLFLKPVLEIPIYLRHMPQPTTWAEPMAGNATLALPAFSWLEKVRKWN